MIVRKAFLRYKFSLAPVGLSVNQFSLLSNLNRLQTASVRELANCVGLDRTTLVRTLKPLIDRKMIEDDAAKGQRSRKLGLTQKGKQTVESCRPLWEKAQEEIERRIGKERMAQLSEILALLNEI